MNSEVIAILILSSFASFCCGALFECSGVRQRVAAVLISLSVTASVCFVVHYAQNGRGATHVGHLKWKQLEEENIYFAPVYIKNGTNIIAVLERDRVFHLIEVPFVPHSAYLTVRRGADGTLVPIQLGRVKTATVVPIFAPATPLVAARTFK